MPGRPLRLAPLGTSHTGGGSTGTTTCPGCRLELPATGGPTHRYIRSSPECWARYGEVLAREYTDRALFGGAHRSTVDAYTAQHPDDQPPKSLVVHLVALHLTLDRAAEPGWVSRAMDAYVRGGGPYPPVDPPQDRGSITVQDVLAADDHVATARAWAAEVWRAWAHVHDTIEELAARL